MTTPDWLANRVGGIIPGLNERTWLVTLNGHPMYKLVAVPAKGKFTCAITQTNNGKRIDRGLEYASWNEALQGGLNELKERLGW